MLTTPDPMPAGARPLPASASSGSLAGDLRRATLPSGLRVVTEHVPGLRSATVGVWSCLGARDETDEQAGSSHFLEHLLFKGTRRRDALTIAAEMDAVGGELNAFTGKESTCYYARVLDADLPRALDLLGDVVTSSLLTPADVETERGVILEELAMHDDDPGDVVHDAFAAALWGDHPLGRPVIGTTASIGGLSRDTIAAFYTDHYTADSLVVTVAGGFGADTHDDVVRRVAESFAAVRPGAAEPRPLRAAAPGPPAASRTVLRRRPTEQAHAVLGVPGLSRQDPRRFALSVLTTALGGGMSSRLFQEVREKRGLAYSVYAFTSSYADAGELGVYLGCAPGRVDEALRVCRGVLADVAADGITAAERDRAVGQLSGSLVLGLEDSGARMSWLGRSALGYAVHLTPDDVLAAYAAVTCQEVAAVAADLLAQPMALGLIGPFDDRAADAGSTA